MGRRAFPVHRSPVVMLSLILLWVVLLGCHRCLGIAFNHEFLEASRAKEATLGDKFLSYIRFT
jgi:hypothetical protein